MKQTPRPGSDALGVGVKLGSSRGVKKAVHKHMGLGVLSL